MTTSADNIIDALRQIARGRPNRMVPLHGEDARQLARKVLAEAGLDWPRPIIRPSAGKPTIQPKRDLV